MSSINWPDFVIKVQNVENLSGEEKRVLLAVVAMIDRDTASRGELTQGEIGAVVRMTQPSVSATLKSLVTRGFLTKDDAPRGNHKTYGFGKKLNMFTT